MHVKKSQKNVVNSGEDSATPGRRSPRSGESAETDPRAEPRGPRESPTDHRPSFYMIAQPIPLFSSALMRSVSDRTASSFMRLSSRSVFSSSPSRPW